MSNLRITERNATAYRLRQAGHTYKQIGLKLGVTANMARIHVLRTEARLQRGLSLPD